MPPLTRFIENHQCELTFGVASGKSKFSPSMFTELRFSTL
jgi:hypothetical protein